jgi:hypothetical protein
MPEEKVDRLKEFQEKILKGETEDYLFFALENLNDAVSKMKEATIDGIKITETSEYNYFYDYFLNIYKDTINNYNLLNFFNINIKKHVENFTNMDDLLLKLIEETKSNFNEDTIKFFLFEPKILESILRGIKDFIEIRELTIKKNIEKEKRFMALNLYKEVFELYLKILKEIYCKKNKINEIKSNRKLYNFYEKNYKILLDTKNRLLRNDISHVTYELRDNYSTIELLEDARIIFIKQVTALIAKVTSIISHFEENIKKILDFNNLKKEN